MANSVQLSSRGGSALRWSRDGDTIAEVEVSRSGANLGSRRALFVLPRDYRDEPDVMPDGGRGLVIRGGSMYSDLVVVQRALAVH